MQILGSPLDVRLWHLASIRTEALNGRCWGHSGHWPTFALKDSVANDPTATSGLIGVKPCCVPFLTRRPVAKC
jgi:hypothetical protein